MYAWEIYYFTATILFLIRTRQIDNKTHSKIRFNRNTRQFISRLISISFILLQTISTPVILTIKSKMLNTCQAPLCRYAIKIREIFKIFKALMIFLQRIGTSKNVAHSLRKEYFCCCKDYSFKIQKLLRSAEKGAVFQLLITFTYYIIMAYLDFSFWITSWYVFQTKTNYGKI